MAGIRELLRQYADRLEKAGIDSPRLSAEVLLAEAMRISRPELLKTLLLSPDREAGADAEVFITRRECGEPVAYITGRKEFFGRDFVVTRATLIPRPDTEILIECALAFAASYSPPELPQFMDMGTGSGAIAVTLALELPGWQGLAVDISREALVVAERNAQALGAANVHFLQRDFLSPLLPPSPYDLVAANPPYVSAAEYAALSREITAYEPKSALVPDAQNATGLECLLAIMDKAETLLRQGGLLLMEMGCTQGDALLEHAASKGGAWRDARILPDLAGLPRVFRATRT